VHGYASPVIEPSGHKALETARRLAIEHAEDQSKDMGGHDLQTECDVRRIDLPNVDEAQSLIGATVTAECTSVPWRAS